MIPITCNAVGDIIALASLVLDITRALSDTRGAASEYLSFTDELNGFHIILTTAARVVKDTDDDALRDEIVREVDRCGRDVQGALTRIAKFSALDPNAVRGSGVCVKLKRNWYKIEWRFGQRDQVQTVGKELSMATQRITTLLTVSNTDGARQFRTKLINQFDVLVSHNTTLSRILDRNTTVLSQLQYRAQRTDSLIQSLSDSVPDGVDGRVAVVGVLCAAICTMHGESRAVPAAFLLVALCLLLLSPRQRLCASGSDIAYSATNAVTLLDALGRQIILPLELCEDYWIFRKTLVNLFSRTSGSWFIKVDKYVLFVDSRPVDWGLWKHYVRCGTKIEMAIMIQHIRPFHTGIMCLFCCVDHPGNVVADRCPNCSSAYRRRDFPEAPERYWVARHFSPEDPDNVSSAYDRGRSPRNSDSIADLPTRANVLSHQADVFETDLFWEPQIREFGRVRVYSTEPRNSMRPVSIDDYLAVAVRGHRGLLAAVENGYHGVVADILAAGGDANTCYPSGYTALHLASWTGHCRIIDLRLHYGAVIDAATDKALSPLALAVMRRRRAAADLLLARGAVVHAPEPVQTAVLCATMWTHDLDVARKLLCFGVDVNRLMSCFNTTALQIAVCLHSEDLVQMLLHRGARLDMPSHPIAHTPLAIAARWGRDTMFELLLTARSTIDSVSLSALEQRELLRCALLGGKARIFTIIADTVAGLDVNAPYADGAAPLMLAVECGHKELVQLLLAHGGNPNGEFLPSSPVGYGSRVLRSGHWHKGHWRPIHAIAQLINRPECVEILELLLNHGADVNASSEVGYTPLSLLAIARALDLHCRKARDEMERLLLLRGAVLDERSTVLLNEFSYKLHGRVSRSCDPLGAWTPRRTEVQNIQSSQCSDMLSSTVIRYFEDVLVARYYLRMLQVIG